MDGGSCPEPSATVPMPFVLGDDSSDSEGEDDAGHGGALTSEGAEAGNTSRSRPADTTVLEVSEDEVGSRSPVVFRSAVFRPQTQRAGGADDVEAGTYRLHMSMMVLVVFIVGFCLCVIFVASDFILVLLSGVDAGSFGHR